MLFCFVSVVGWKWQFRWLSGIASKGVRVWMGWQEQARVSKGGKRWQGWQGGKGGKGNKVARVTRVGLGKCQRRQRRQLLLLVSLFTSCLGVWHEIKHFKRTVTRVGLRKCQKRRLVRGSASWSSSGSSSSSSFSSSPVSRQPLRASAQGTGGQPARLHRK